MEFKQPTDGNTEPENGNLVSEIASAAAASSSTGHIPLLPNSDNVVVLPAGASLDDLSIQGRDILVKLPDGRIFVIPDGAVFVPVIAIDGVTVPPLNLAAYLTGDEPQPAAGTPQSSGGNFADPADPIQPSYGLGDLLPYSELSRPVEPDEEVLPDLVEANRVPGILFVPRTGDGTEVRESLLPPTTATRVNESAGSQFDGGADVTSGVIQFVAEDGLGCFSISGVVLVPGTFPQTVVSDQVGTLVVTGLTFDPVTGLGEITYDFTLNDNTFDPDGTTITFDLVVTDTDGDSSSDVLTITIIDDVPTAAADSNSVDEGGTVSGNVLTDNVDEFGADGNGTPTFSSGVIGVRPAAGDTATEVTTGTGTVIAGEFGTLTLNADGTYTYESNGDGVSDDAQDVFVYTIEDGDGDRSTTTLTIDLADVTLAADNDTITVNEAALDTDRDGNDLAEGTVTGSDPASTAETTGGTLNVPGATGYALAGSATGTYGTIQLNADGSYTYTLTTPFDNLPHANDGTETQAPGDVFSYVATDAGGNSVTGTITVNIVDDVPDAQDDSASLTEGGPSFVDFDVDTNDTPGADGTGSRTFDTLTGTYGDLTLNGDGTQTYTLNAAGQTAIDGLAPGATLTDTFNYTLTDGDGDADPAVLTVTLNGADDPVVISNLTPKLDGGDVTVDEDDLVPDGSDQSDPLTVTGTFNISAPDGIDDLTVGGQAVITNGAFTATSFTTLLGNTLSITSFNSGTGEITYSYTLLDNETHANADGENSLFEDFAVVLTDVDTSIANDILSVNIVDDVPDANPDSNSVTEGASATGNVLTDNADIFGADGPTTTAPVGGVIGVRAAAGDTTTEVTGGTGTVIAGQFGTLTLTADGTYTYNSTAGAITADAQDVFVYTIEDGDGDRSTTTLTIDLADVTGNVNDNNVLVDESGLDAIGSQIVPDGEFFTTGQITVTGTAGPLTYTLTSASDGTFGTLSLDSNTGAYSYTLDTPFDGPGLDDGRNTINGAESFTYEVTDQFSNVIGTGSIAVSIVDDVPTANADSNSVTEGGSASGNVLTDNADVFGADGPATTSPAGGVIGVRAAAGDTTSEVTGGTGTVITGQFGTLTLNADGTYTYNSTTNGITGDAQDVFVYTIEDGDGDRSTTTLTIDLADVSLVADNDTVAVNEAALDTVQDGDDLAPGTVTGSNPASTAETTGGTLNVPGATGYALTGSATGTYGTIEINADGSYTYTLTSPVDNLPHANDGTETKAAGDVFTYQATDANGNSVTGTITVNIIDDVPTAVADSNSVTEGASASGNVLTDNADVFGADGPASTSPAGGVIGVRAAAGDTTSEVTGGTSTVIAGEFGTLTLNSDGTYTYNSTADSITADAQDVFVYSIEDGDGDRSTTTLTISIADITGNVNDNNVLVDESGLDATGSQIVPDGEFFTTGQITVSGSAGPLTYTLTSPSDGTYGTLSLDANTGTYSYTLDTPFDGPGLDDARNTINGAESFAYEVTDQFNNVIGTGSIGVSIVDDVPTANPDSNSVTEGGSVSGNVLTDNADVFGADGAATTAPAGGVIGVRPAAGDTATEVTTGTGTVIAGEFGTLTLNADGTYTYESNGDGVSDDAQDVFVYTIEDGDGDRSTTTLTIDLADVTLAADNDTITVNEAALDTDRDGNDLAEGTVTGSDPASTAETTGGTLNVPGATGYALAGSATGTYGTIQLNADGSYTYTLTTPFDNLPHANDGTETQAPGDVFSYVATDAGGNSVTGTITVNIVDDVPDAQDDSASLTEGGPSFVDFDVDTNDTPGADGTGSRTFDTLTGTYGDLTLNGDGTQTYTLNAAGQTAIDGLAPGATLTDTFNYTLTDGDGDADPAVLTVTLNGADDPVVISNLTPKLDGGDVTVDEDDLVPDGSDQSDPLTVTGTFNISAPDGIDDLTVGGQAVITNGAFTATSFTTLLGNTLSITSFNSGTGEITYSYTLLDNETHANADGENSLFEDFAVVLTDVDTSIANDILSVNIVDDVPDANPDSNSVTEGASATGNVLTDNADIFGADGPATTTPVGGLIGVRFAGGDTTTAVTTGADGVTVINGDHGTLTLDADGTYTYNSTANAISGTEQDVFVYTIEDGDGDRSTTTLTIDLTDITLAADDRDHIVDEAAMDTATTPPDIANGSVTGSNPSSTAETVTGTLGVTGTGVAYTPISTTTAFGSFELDASGNYTYTLTAPATHPNSGTDTLIDVETFNYTATDANGNTVGGAISIDIIDDIPQDFTPDDALGTNDGNDTLSGSLDDDLMSIFDDTGADGLGSLAFDIASPGTPLTNINGTLQSSGEDILLYVQPDGSLVATTDNTDAGATVFTATLNETNGTYEIVYSDTLDNGSGVVLSDFDTLAAGNTIWKGLDADLLDIASPSDPNPDSTDLLFTGRDAANDEETINSDNNDIGVGGAQAVDTGETLRIDLVQDLRRDATKDESDSGGYLYDNHVGVNQFTFGTVDVKAGPTATTVIRIKAFNVDDNNALSQSDVDNPAVNTAVALDHSTVVVLDSGGNPAAGITIYDDGDNIVVDGLQDGDTVSFSAVGGLTFEAVEFENADGDPVPGGAGTLSGNGVGMGAFAYNFTAIGDPVEFSLPVILTDGDGDTSTGAIDVTMNPVIFDPIVLDLDGDGTEFLSMSAGVAFDYDGDGVANATAWVGADDGLLTVDLNQDGVVNDGSEFVFGGNGLTDLEGLALNYDTNQDGQLDANDAAFALFGVWQDANSNGLTDAGEWHSLADMNITSISLVSDNDSYSAAGGDVKVHGEASYMLADGTTGNLADASFAVGAERINARNMEMVTTAIAAGIMASAFLAEDAHAAQSVPNETGSLLLLAATYGSDEGSTTSGHSSHVTSTELFLSDDAGTAASEAPAAHAHDTGADDQDSTLADAQSASDEGSNSAADWMAAPAENGADEGALIVSVSGMDASMEALLALDGSGPSDGSQGDPGQVNEGVIEEALVEAAGDSFVDQLLDQLGSSDADASVQVSDSDLAGLLGAEMGGDALISHNGLDIIQALEDATALAGTQG